jgi:Family of unknown function (DUF6455)
MVTYEDCLGFSALTPEAIAAVARHEQIPDILALELGAQLCATREGQDAVKRMILDDIEDARDRGDTKVAAHLEQVLRHFVESAMDGPPPAPLEWSTGAAETSREPTDATARHDPLEQRIHALGFDATSAPWVRRRVEAHLSAMVSRSGLDLQWLRDRFPLELLAAETRCAACQESPRCRRFLAGAAAIDGTDAFCPNAALFHEFRQQHRLIADNSESARRAH